MQPRKATAWIRKSASRPKFLPTITDIVTWTEQVRTAGSIAATDASAGTRVKIAETDARRERIAAKGAKHAKIVVIGENIAAKAAAITEITGITDAIGAVTVGNAAITTALTGGGNEITTAIPAGITRRTEAQSG